MAYIATTGEARDALHKIGRRFDAGEGEPVYFGSHRRAQGVIVPVDLWEKLLEKIEDEFGPAFERDRFGYGARRRLTRDEINAFLDRHGSVGGG